MGPEGASFKAVSKPLPDHLPGKSALKKKSASKKPGTAGHLLQPSN